MEIGLKNVTNNIGASNLESVRTYGPWSEWLADWHHTPSVLEGRSIHQIDISNRFSVTTTYQSGLDWQSWSWPHYQNNWCSKVTSGNSLATSSATWRLSLEGIARTFCYRYWSLSCTSLARSWAWRIIQWFLLHCNVDISALYLLSR